MTAETLRYSTPVKCAECGRKKKSLWTMLCSFQALDMGMIVPKRSGKVHLPLTAVCHTHLLAAETEPAEPDDSAMQSRVLPKDDAKGAQAIQDVKEDLK